MPFHNVLLIDDDEDDQEIFLTAAKEVSGRVKCTSLFDAREALKKLEIGELVPDVIFLDLNMPVMNGQQFLTEIKKKLRLKSIPIIIFSTTSNDDTIVRMKALGAHDFITKPNRYDQLLEILKKLLN
ncbi:MAG: response regulator [Chryseolinea sp.]